LSGKNSQLKIECQVCELVVDKIEEVFCKLIGDKVSPKKCRELMEKRRMGKLTYESLIKTLGLKEDDFNKTLDEALKQTKKIVEKKN